MAYAGYLLKVNGVIFPNKYILMDSYKSTPHQLTDLDSYTDGDGELHRNVLPHTRSKIWFDTGILIASEKTEIKSIIPMSKTGRVRMTVEYWADDIDAYDTGSFYVPDVEFPIYDADNAMIIYNSISITFIEY